MADPRHLFACPSCGARVTLALVAVVPGTAAAPSRAAESSAAAARLIPVPEVCRRLGCSKKHVYKLIGRHGDPPELPHVKIGVFYTVPESAVDRWIEANMQNAAAG